MSLITNTKNVFMLTTLLFFFSGCGGGGGGATSSTTVATESPATTETTTATETTDILKAVEVQTHEPMITENSATIEWIQNDYITELVEYGTSKKYNSEILVKEEGTITLYNLQANTTYHYRIVAKDKNDRKVVSRDRTFTTLEQSTQIVTEPTPEPIVEPTPEPIVEPTPEPELTPTPAENEVQNLQSRVSSSSNDAEELENGRTYIGSSDLELTYDNGFNSLQTIGMRFTDLVIPQNAVITKAYIQFKVDETSTESTQLSIYGEAVDNAVAFNTTTYNISSRTKTGASASWSPAPWNTIGEAGEAQRTSDLTSIVQEIVSGSGWNSGNAMVFIIAGTGKRVVESYDGDETGAPQLVVEYTITDNRNSPEPIVEPTPNPEPVPEVSDCKSGPAQHSGQITDSISRIGLADVTVTISGCSTKTDADGYYALQNIAASEETVVNFEKEGYLLGSTQIQIKSLSGDDTSSTNYLEYSMHAHNYPGEFDSTEEIPSSAHIIINDSTIYTDADGKPYSGSGTTGLTILNITTDEEKRLFPGTFKGINTYGTMVQFESYGLITLSLKDSNGNRLDLADGETATLSFDVVSSLEKPDTLPLWNYDYDQGRWFEEGYAQLQEDGSYKGEISHLGTWSLNKVLEDESGIYRGRIIDKDGSPMSDVRLYATGDNWVSSDLTTDEDGVFEIEVIPGKSFQLAAYNYKDKYKASYSNKIAAITSGEIVEN